MAWVYYLYGDDEYLHWTAGDWTDINYYGRGTIDVGASWYQSSNVKLFTAEHVRRLRFDFDAWGVSVIGTADDAYINAKGLDWTYISLWGSNGNSVMHVSSPGTNDIWASRGNDVINVWVGGRWTGVHLDSGNDELRIHSGINADITLGSGDKLIATNYLAGSVNIYETAWWSQRDINVSAWYGYVQVGNGNDTIGVHGLSQAIVEDAGGNNTVSLGGGGYLKAVLGWGSVKNGSDTVHLYAGWNADIVKSGGSLYVYNHSYRGGNTSIWTSDGHWNNSLDNLGYYDASAWSNNIDVRVNKHADINAHGLGWNYINLWGSDGSSRMDITSPGTNEIWATRGNDEINVWEGGRWTDVHLDHGDDWLRIHSGLSAKVSLGNGNKRINTNHLAGDVSIYECAWGTSGSRNMDISAGNVDVKTSFGDDTLKVFGVWTAKIDDAGGNNTIDARGAGVEVKTGHGNDTIYVSGVSAKVSSGNGNDSITLDGLDARLNDDDAWGNKQVLARAGGAYIYTGHGHDAVEFYGLGSHIQTGAGNDSVTVRGVGAHVDTGDGNDTVDVRTAGASVSTGSGNDSVWSLGVGGQKIDLGDGDDKLEAYGGANIIYAGRNGKKSVKVGGALNVVQVGHGDSTVEAYGGMNVVLTGHGNNAVHAYGGGNFLLNGNGRYTADAYGGLNVILSGLGQAEINAFGGTNIVMAGDKGNTIRAYGVGYLTGIGNLVISGAGDDRIKVGGLLAAVTTSFGDSSDEFAFDRIVVIGKDAGDTIGKTALNVLSLTLNTAFNAGNVVIAGDGNNKVKAYGGYNFVQTGSGDDEVSMVGALNAAVVGNGRNRIFAIGGNNIAVAGSGHDEMQAIGGANVFFANAGNNRMTAIGSGNLFMAADGNDDMLAMGGSNIAIMGGGNNTALLAGGFGNLVQGGSGDDRVIALSQWNVMILGDGNNTVGALGGGGNLVWTGSGNDTVISLGLYAGNILLLGDGNNFAISGGRANIVIAGSGRDSVLSVGQYNLVSTANGIDNVISIGEYNLVHTGGDDDLAAVIGKINLVDTGWGHDVALVIGKTNIVLTEAGDDTGLVIGQNNYVFSGSGNDMVAVFGQTNYVLTGSGHDLVAVFGKKNFVATDNEIVFNDDDLIKEMKESEKVKGWNGKGKDWSEKTGLEVSTQAELKLSADLAIYFPDIEFSTAQSADWKYPTLTLPSYSYQIPSTPALRSAPDYAYGKLGDYGLPSLSFPMLSSPQLQLPGITIPSFSIPSIPDIGVKVDQLKPNFFYDFNVGSDWFGGLSSSFQSLTGLPSSASGSSSTLLGGRVSFQPKLSGDVGFHGTDLTGKVSASSQANANAVVASAATNADGQINASTSGAASASGGVFGAGNLFNEQGADGISGSTSTGNKDKFLMVDGSTNGGDAFWKQSVPMVAGADYTFSFWAASGCDPQPQLQLSLDGAPIGSVQTLSQSSGWTQYSVAFKANSSGTQTLALTDLTARADGNDFGIDSLRLTSADNFITNGDFSEGTSGFTSDYALQAQAMGAKTAGVVDTPPDWGLGVSTGLGNGQLSTSSTAGSVEYALPTLSFGDIKLPDLQLNGFDFSGYSKLFTTLFSGRDLYGATLPDFTLPEFKVDNVNLSDYVGGTQALTIKGMSYTLPSLYLPKIAGIDYQSRLPSLKTHYQFHQGDGDVAVVGGEDNRVMTGHGDDLSLVMGKTNALFMGDGNDAGLMVGETNAWRGGAGNDFILAAGKENAAKGNEGQDILFVVGATNKVEGGSGDDVAVVLGRINSADGGEGKDLMLIVGQKNNVNMKLDDSTGDGNDTILVLGQENNVKGGRGDDWLIACGATNAMDGGQGSDVVVAAGWKNVLHGDFVGAENGDDVLVFLGGANEVHGNGGKDLILGAGLANQVQGNAGDDIAITAGLTQNVDLGDGHDKAVTLGAFNNVSAGAGQDVLYVAGAGNNVFAGSGNDVLFALGAGNLLWGQDGDDVFLASGVGSRQLSEAGKLSCALGAIDVALDMLNKLGSSIGDEAVPSSLNDYQRRDNTYTYADGAEGSDTFYSGYQCLLADGGAGSDRYVYFLGDGGMTVRDSSGDADTLVIQAGHVRSLGADVDLAVSDLYYDPANGLLSIIKAGKSYGEIALDGFGGGSDTITLQGVGGCSSVSLSSLPAYSGAATQTWSPVVPGAMAPSWGSTDVNHLYGFLDKQLAINSAVLS
ncbi:DUF642 domain-containing protein [Sphaerotilus mobilis]|uniref:Uncharacterized protein DUF642 n=1 Tax=Sphaerotilus mobilis TaxID=47994 RepID=A0A4Q7LTA7_9BURK|nr:DUF642 domain-containing protein [Sphaerotilus mobilis]RZS56999.1 uncharacterized protein DUF642 [Sphaerotilus mobilis]